MKTSFMKDNFMKNIHSSHFCLKVKKAYRDYVTHTASTLNTCLLKNPHRAPKITSSNKSEGIYSSNWEFSKTYSPPMLHCQPARLDHPRLGA